MASRDDQLFDEVGRLLEPRLHWNLEPSTTPGGAPSWCFDPGGEVELSVSVSDGLIDVYQVQQDRDLFFPGVDALAAWVEDNEARFSGREPWP